MKAPGQPWDDGLDHQARHLVEEPPPEDDPGPMPTPADHDGRTTGRGPLAERLLTRSQLDSLPEPEPLIENTLDRRTVALLGGYWGTLKSFIALDWALSVATGHPWQGRPTVTGPVIYGVDTVYQTEGDHTGIILKRTKRKDGPPDDVLQLRLETVLDSGVSQNRVRRSPGETDLLSHFVSHFSETGATTAQRCARACPRCPEPCSTGRSTP
jgi:AAA domain